jgi:phosphate transport system substrate-binding protein
MVSAPLSRNLATETKRKKTLGEYVQEQEGQVMRSGRRVWRSLAASVGLAFVVGFAIGCSGCNSSSSGGGGGSATRLSGGGATFINPLMQEWKQAYKAAKGVEIDYQPKGSGFGIQQMTSKTIDFGCSDAPMRKAQLDAALKEGGEVIHIPLTMGPVAVIYNLPGVDKALTLNGKVIAEIYLGKIKKWNDPALKELNKDLNLPDTAISPVFRSEASGTTNIFKEFLAKSSPEFKQTVGVSTEPTWPKGVGTGERGNDGVANQVKQSTGTIGYCELSYAKEIKYATLINRVGKPVACTLDGTIAAAEVAMKQKQTEEPYSLHELTFSLTDSDGEKSYPICGFSYCVLYKKQPAGTGKGLVDFLKWGVHDGQKLAPSKDYAPLPDELVQKIDARLNQVEFAP